MSIKYVSCGRCMAFLLHTYLPTLTFSHPNTNTPISPPHPSLSGNFDHMGKISLHFAKTMIYKILNGHSAITPDNFFEFNKTQTRKKHNLTLRTYQPRGNIDKFAFVQRSIPEWNTLPNVVVQANSTEQFRVLLEKHLQQNPLPSLAF